MYFFGQPARKMVLVVEGRGLEIRRLDPNYPLRQIQDGSGSGRPRPVFILNFWVVLDGLPSKQLHAQSSATQKLQASGASMFLCFKP